MSAAEFEAVFSHLVQLVWISIPLLLVCATIAGFRAMVTLSITGFPSRRHVREQSGRECPAQRAAAQQENESARRIYKAAAVEHDRVRDEYGSWLGNHDTLLTKSSLGDVTVPETAEFIEALAVANDARPDENTVDMVRAKRWRADVERASAAWSAATERAARAPAHRQGRGEGAVRRLITRAREKGAAWVSP